MANSIPDGPKLVSVVYTQAAMPGIHRAVIDTPLVYHSDGLGSVRALTEPSGSVVQTYQYDEYGVVVSSQGSITQPFQYTGEVSDDYTKLVYLRARYQTDRHSSRRSWAVSIR